MAVFMSNKWYNLKFSEKFFTIIFERRDNRRNGLELDSSPLLPFLKMACTSAILDLPSWNIPCTNAPLIIANVRDVFQVFRDLVIDIT